MTKNQRPENKRQFHAFEVYRDLGYGRTFREVSRQIGSSVQSVCRWAKSYDWDDRLAKYNVVVAQKKKEGALIVTDSNPITLKMVTMLEQAEALIDSVFIKDDTGKLSPLIKIKHADEVIKLIAEYRKLLETYHRFVAEHLPAKKEKDRGTQTEELNRYLASMSQQDRIAALKGVVIGGDDKGRDKQPAGTVQDADYTEVSGQGSKD